MPKYLFPGVYVEERDAEAKEISGSPTSLGDRAWEDLAVEVRRVFRTSVPGWTDTNEADAGVTILELFAFLSENLLYRANQIPERGRPFALRAAAALAVVGGVSNGVSEGVQRPVFFDGRLLDAATLRAEQDYLRERLRRHNRFLLGYGVVSGLAVHVEPDDLGGSRVVVDQGCAIDSRGEEISVPGAATVALPAYGDSAFVTLRYWEHPCVLDVSSVEEACVIGIHTEVISPAIPLARLVGSDRGWRIDPEFSPPRVRRRDDCD